MGKLPYVQWYVGDHVRDPARRRMSLEARGGWDEILWAMCDAGQTGEWRGTREELTRLMGCNADVTANVLRELVTSGTANVTEMDGVVTVVNRRMKREADARKSANERQKRKRNKGRPVPVTQGSLFDHAGSSTSPSSTDPEDPAHPIRSGSPAERVTPPPAEASPQPPAVPIRLGGDWFEDLWIELGAVRMAQGLLDVRMLIEQYAHATGVTTLDGVQQLARRAVQAFTAYRATCTPGYVPPMNGYGFQRHWERIQLVLNGSEKLEQPGSGAMPIATLKFGGGGPKP